MKIINIILLIVLFETISYSQSGWFLVDIGTTYHLKQIQFLDINNGFILGSGYDSLNSIFKTTNSGLNWSNTPVPSSRILGGFCFVNLNTGYICGETGYLRKTTNSGINWFDISFVNNDSYNLIIFLNNSTGFINGVRKIYKTTNAGINWTVILDRPDLFLRGMTFPSVDTAYVYGTDVNTYESSLFRTTNSANTWDPISYFGLSGSANLYFYNAKIGFVLKFSGTLRTTTAGTSWSTIFTESPIADAFFLNPDTGYICGAYGRVYRTTNAGLNWENQITTGGATMSSICFVNDLTGFVCGQNGIVKKTTNGGSPIGIHRVSTEIPNDYLLLQKYPNPFNPNTIINFKIVKGDFVKLTVYDLLGRETVILVNEELKPGTYETDFDGSNLPSGVYYYKITTGDFTQTKKMVLLK
jgi:photosystem II stability/assembly factor-like uncharacterized protein